MADLTSQQTLFCQKYIEHKGNASEAYRQSYKCENSNNHTIRNEAYLLLQNPDITQTIEKLQEEHAERHRVTVDSLTDEYNEIKLLAMAKEDYSPAISAINGKAKIHGFDKSTIALDIPKVIRKNLTGKRDVTNGE